ncbi:AAA family ATPase [Candidatus Woesearchaeota archaeon]|nr:AAA family ATPase [Candidatus Woesearchaeota archaeon]
MPKDDKTYQPKVAGLPVAFDDAAKQLTIQSRLIPKDSVYYEPQGDELGLFEKAIAEHLSVAMIGPTGSGKSRLLQYMAAKHERPYFYVVGNTKMGVDELIGTPLTEGDSAVFMPGPLYQACATGGFIAIEEVLEMHADARTCLHSLADARRSLEVAYVNELLVPDENFVLTIMFNPGAAYQSVNNLWPKPSFAQRFVFIELPYVRGNIGENILMKESGCDKITAEYLMIIADRIDTAIRDRALTLAESVGYHALVKTAKLIVAGTNPQKAIHACISRSLSPNNSDVKTIDTMASFIKPASR